MKEMDDLLEITTTLIEPGGCPWDAQQTLRSLQKYFLEEVHEVVEAIDRDDAKNMSEELGDVFYLILFAAKIAEKQQLFSIQDVISEQKEKLIRRHPHVFSKEKSDSSLSIEELEAKWDAIKKQENAQKEKNLLKSIPRNTPTLLVLQKILRKLAKDPDFSLLANIESLPTPFQKNFFHFVYKEALSSDIDMEGEVRRGLQALEEAYIAEEKTSPEKS